MDSDSDDELIFEGSFNFGEQEALTETRLKAFFKTGIIPNPGTFFEDSDDEDDEYEESEDEDDVQSRRNARRSRRDFGSKSEDKDRHDNTCNSCDQSNGVAFVLDQLNRFPNLAQVKFKGKGENKGCFPFMHLIRAGAGKDALEKVYEMHPDAIGEPVFDIEMGDIYPISYACAHRSNDIDIMRFLVEKCPDGVLSETTAAGLLPIHIAIGKRADRRTIRYLLNGYPQAVTKMKYPKDCLSLACLTKGTHPRVVNILAKQFIHEGGKHFVCDKRVAERLHDIHALKWMMHMGQLEHFTYVCDGQPIAEKVLERLIQEGGVELRKGGSDPWDFIDTLKALIKAGKSTVEKVTLEWRQDKLGTSEKPIELDSADGDGSTNSDSTDGMADDHDNSIGTHTISYMPRQKALSICYRQSVSTFEVKTCLTPVSNGLSLDRGNEFLEKLQPSLCIVPPHSKLMGLRLVDMMMTSGRLSEMLKYAAGLPSLESLVLSYKEETSMRENVAKANFTELLLVILRKNRLKVLEITGLKVQVGDICQTLQPDNGLTSLVCSEIAAEDEVAFEELMKRHSSLTKLSTGTRSGLPFSKQGLQRIEYFTKLNFFGRGKIQRCEKMSTRALVDLFCHPLLLPTQGDNNQHPSQAAGRSSSGNSEDDSSDDEDEEEKEEEDVWHQDPDNVLTVYYYILRENPQLCQTFAPATVSPNSHHIQSSSRMRKRKHKLVANNEAGCIVIDD